MLDWFDFNHSMKKANISVAVAIAILIGGALLIGLDAPAIQRQVVAMVAFVAGYTCLFWLYRHELREQREQQRAERAERAVGLAHQPREDRAA